MRKILLLIFCILFATYTTAQQTTLPVDSIPNGYFVTHSRSELMKKLSDLPSGIKVDDPIPVIIKKIEKFLISYQPQKQYPDDLFAKESILQAVQSFKEGGYGIGAILVDSKGNIICKSHNSQIQKHRSDLHAEMALLTNFEESPASKEYLNVYVYKPGLTVYSSSEPCPMCFIRLSTARVNTKYCTPGPDDGMASRIDCLPPDWREMAHKYPCKKAQSSPVLQKVAHLMFFSYLLDNRGPK
jgi:tRNA(Arg) A34 adenosine deaminase TadA